jgi:hypothetical protein
MGAARQDSGDSRARVADSVATRVVSSAVLETSWSVSDRTKVNGQVAAAAVCRRVGVASGGGGERERRSERAEDQRGARRQQSHGAPRPNGH